MLLEHFHDRVGREGDPFLAPDYLVVGRFNEDFGELYVQEATNE